MQSEESRHQRWKKSHHANLFSLDGVYYARLQFKGKPIRKSFKTRNYNVALAKLKELQFKLGVEAKPVGSTWGGMLELYSAYLAGRKTKNKIGDSTIEYKQELLDNIRSTYRDFDVTDLEKLTADELDGWITVHHAKYSAPRTNGAITVLREILRLAVKKRTMSEATATDALKGLVFVPVKYDTKRLSKRLPDKDQLVALRNEVYRRCQSQGSFGGWLFDLLLFSGCRIDSANHVQWMDVKWDTDGGRLDFRKAKTKAYDVPLFPQLRELLERIKRERPGKPTDLVLPVKSLHTALPGACKQLGLAHLSHHDLRHIFATQCIEAGVDIPTVAAWLGHNDGGRTCMAVYGHHRKDHSREMATKMNFLPV